MESNLSKEDLILLRLTQLENEIVTLFKLLESHTAIVKKCLEKEKRED